MSTIARFMLVQIDSAADGHPVVVPWAPAAYEQPGLATAHKILGVTMTASDYEEPIAVMRRGTMRDVTAQNAETWAAGDLLWAMSDGSITKTRPAAPLPLVLVGTVFAVDGAACTVDIDVRVLPSLGELSGVSVESPSDLDVIIYKASTHLWEPRRLAGGDISNTPAGNLSATDVQAAINELDSEKVALAGQLGGSVASPDVRGLRETGGPTLLTLGEIADGKYLKRVGTSVVGADAAGGASALDDLTDVDASTPEDGDTLIFDSSSERWINGPGGTGGGVPTARTISTTLPLTGGGDLSADRTLAVNDFGGDAGAGGTKGAVPAPGVGDAAAGKYLKASGGWDVPAGTGVPTARTISTTAPLTGGGDLSENRTLAIDAFTGDSGAGGTKGAVPAPAAGDTASGRFLKADGSWAVPGTIAAGTITLSKQFAVAYPPPTGSTNFPFWQAEQAITIKKIRAYMIGSGSCAVNVTKNGSDLLGANLSPSSSWGSSAGFSTNVSSGDDIDIEIRSVTGIVSYVAVQIDYTV